VETGRIEDGPRLKALVKDGGITHIVHLAAVLMPFCQAQPAEGGMVNVIGTLNVFEAARDAGRAVRVVYASSSAVWGPE
jgi:nucleoside-diphosphate-sugar epimerase